jgi:outer membrane lipoprotein
MTSMNIWLQAIWRNAGRPALIGMMVCIPVFLFGACTPVISTQLMDQVDRDVTYSALVANPDEFRGKIVLLGGTIVQTMPKPKETEIEIVQKPISSSGEPHLTDKSEGRFLVVVDRFLDPAIYQSGRDLTVAGEVRGSEARRLGEIDYRYPVITAQELHLWRRPAVPPAYPFYPYPFGYPAYWQWRHYPGY